MKYAAKYAAGLLPLFLLATVAAHAQSAAKYGLDGAIVTDDEKRIDQDYGGFPNNPFFNNDTLCDSVLQLFGIKGVGPTDHRMALYLSYSRVKLMELDITFSTLNHVPPLIDKVELKYWQALPALGPQYCRTHPDGNLEDATYAIYKSARIANGM